MTTSPAVVTLSTPDQRMIDLINRLKLQGTIRTRQAFLDQIGVSKQGYGNIASGKQHFQIHHIIRACQVYSVDSNWILGLKDA